MDEEKKLWQRLTDWERSPVLNHIKIRYWMAKLKSDDGQVKSHAADLLGIIVCRSGHKYTVPALIDALKDEDERVRDSAACALGSITDKRGNPPDYDWKDAVPTLIEALTDENKKVRHFAAWALENIIELVKNYRSTEQLDELQKKVQEIHDGLKEKNKKGYGCAEVKLAKLMIAISVKRNSLAPDKGILLDDKPKPPKKGMYRTIGMTGIAWAIR